MHILIAPDSFKESLSAPDVAQSIAQGLKRVWPDATYTLCPMADGGEGTVETLVNALGGSYVPAPAHDPLMRPIFTQYGLINDGSTALIEVAKASGLDLVTPDERDTLAATSYGTGELIAHALDQGIREFIIGLGGSATTDGGAGIAQALGFTLLDNQGQVIPKGGAGLLSLASIDHLHAHAGIDEAQFSIACDVTNPLVGPTGSAHVYGPQKGASQRQVELLDQALKHYSTILQAYTLNPRPKQYKYIHDLHELPGAGAAGGIAAGLLALLPANLAPGVELIAQAYGLNQLMKEADLVITGEGKIDFQTHQGKVPSGIAMMAEEYNKPVIAFCGTREAELSPDTDALFTTIYAIDSIAHSSQDAMQQAATHLATLAETFANEWAGC